MTLSPQFSTRVVRTAVATALVALIYSQWKQWYGLDSILFILAGAVVGAILGTTYHAIRFRISRRNPEIPAEILTFPANGLDEAA